LKALLATAAAAPELILQAETFLRVIPCFWGEKSAWSHWEGWVRVYFLPALLSFLPWWEKEESYCCSSSCGWQN